MYTIQRKLSPCLYHLSYQRLSTSRVGQMMDCYPKISSRRPLFEGLSARIPYTIQHYSSLFDDGVDIHMSTLPGGRNVHHAAVLQRDLVLGWESFIRGQWHWSWHQVQHRRYYAGVYWAPEDG
jgi:hypothetical protein